MNIDRFNPLSTYLAENGVEVSDWGIEESTTISSPTVSSQHGLNGTYAHPLPPSLSQLPPPPSLSQLQYHQLQYHRSSNQSRLHSYGLVSPSSIYAKDPFLQAKDAMSATSSEKSGFMHYYQQSRKNFIYPTTHNFHKFIVKYLSLNKVNQAFSEKFKYSLIISDLLDHAMILSKNEVSLNTLMYNDIKNHQKPPPKYINSLNHDGSELAILSKDYQLKIPEQFCNQSLILTCISLIIFLLKQNLTNTHSKLSHASKIKMFKILIIVSTKIIHYRRVSMTIQSNKILNKLNAFLISNYKMNKTLIQNFLNLKELSLFQFMHNSKSLASNPHFLANHVDSLKQHLDITLSFLIFNLKNSIIKLLPFLNGEILEKYCKVNNIDSNTLSTFTSYTLHMEDEWDDTEASDAQRMIWRLTEKMNTFNQLRKFFICQLLSFNDPPQKNFFLCKLWDQFNVDETEAIELTKNVTAFEKLLTLDHIFTEHTAAVTNFNATFQNFEKISKMTLSFSNHDSMNQDMMNQDIVQANGRPMQPPSSEDKVDETNINNLINKLSSLATNLRYFKKYNRSTSHFNNADELNEKLMIFSQFGEEIGHAKELYQVNLNDLQNELYQRFNANSDSQTSSPSVSQKHCSTSSILSGKAESVNRGPFNLKSFHTVSSSSNSNSNSNSIKKRFSLPVHNSGNKDNDSPSASPVIPKTPESTTSSKVPNSKTNDDLRYSDTSPSQPNDRKYKRLSTGLQLGLLTVFEEPDKGKSSSRSSSRLHGRTSSVVSSMSSSANKLGRPPANITTSDNSARNRTVSYDDNYINILPPSQYETYNRATFDSLNKRMSVRNPGISSVQSQSLRNSNRFSMNSLNSNVSGLSDLLASTQITSFDDDEGTINGAMHSGNGVHLSKEELKIKLEESFNRIYNLEHENEGLKLKVSSPGKDNNMRSSSPSTLNSSTFPNRHGHDTSIEEEPTEGLPSTNSTKHNHTFLNQLEKTLSIKVDP